MNETAILLGATTLWCVLHSTLLGDSVAGRLRRHGAGAWHRLLYNGFALLSLLPLLLLFQATPGELLWAWHGFWQLPRALLALAAAGLLVGGVRAFDNRAFLGLSQISDPDTDAPDRLSRQGVLGRVRHPYYAAGLLVLGIGTDFTTTNVVWRAVFVLYLLVGTVLEERRLLRRFGDEYRTYRRETPAFLPRLRGSASTGDPRHVP